LALGQPSARPGDCPAVEERGLQNSELVFASHVFPNPANGAFNVQLNREIQEGMVRLLDAKGQSVGSWNFAGMHTTINPANDLQGVFLLEVSNQGQILCRNKIVLIR
jgi:hypothetical protein